MFWADATFVSRVPGQGLARQYWLTWAHIAEAGTELALIPLSHSPKGWGDKCATPSQFAQTSENTFIYSWLNLQINITDIEA